MFVGTYRFAGDPSTLLPAYERLMAGFGDAALSFHACVTDDSSITIIDACPSRTAFLEFSRGTAFASAMAAAGLPEPEVTLLGHVHVARLFDKVVGS